MSKETDIQWADSTVNPIMGCGGCELFPKPAPILNRIDAKLQQVRPRWPDGSTRNIAQVVIDNAHKSAFGEGNSNEVNTTNLYHCRNYIADAVAGQAGPVAHEIVVDSIEEAVRCYAAVLHLRKAFSIANPERSPNKGYAPYFEYLTQFPGRMAKMAAAPDLLGAIDPNRPWIDRLARLIFISDMGDAFSTEVEWEFLLSDVMPPIVTNDGMQHLWLWLTKRPATMARFGERIGGFPVNVCAMTTLTCADDGNLNRLRELKNVNAQVRGLSVEPLQERIPPEKLDLEGIDWIIVGGESGARKHVIPFHLEWARELRDHCRKHRVAFFCKQLGSLPVHRHEELRLQDRHGGNWMEWPADLRFREFPEYFHQYRRDEMPVVPNLRRKHVRKGYAV